MAKTPSIIDRIRSRLSKTTTIDSLTEEIAQVDSDTHKLSARLTEISVELEGAFEDAKRWEELKSERAEIGELISDMAVARAVLTRRLEAAEVSARASDLASKKQELADIARRAPKLVLNANDAIARAVEAFAALHTGQSRCEELMRDLSANDLHFLETDPALRKAICEDAPQAFLSYGLLQQPLMQLHRIDPEGSLQRVWPIPVPYQAMESSAPEFVEPAEELARSGRPYKLYRPGHRPVTATGRSEDAPPSPLT